jgi:hypothetical protein
MDEEERGSFLNQRVVLKLHLDERPLDLPGLLAKKSHFLLGPRQTGKTFLIRHNLKNVKVYDLLDTATYLRISQNPGRIGQELSPADRTIRGDS